MYLCVLTNILPQTALHPWKVMRTSPSIHTLTALLVLCKTWLPHGITSPKSHIYTSSHADMILNINSDTSLFLQPDRHGHISICFPKDLLGLQPLCKLQTVCVCPKMNYKAMPNSQKATSMAVKKIFKYMYSFVITAIPR